MDGQTDIWADMMKLTVTFCNFTNVPQNRTTDNKCYKDIRIYRYLNERE